MFKSKKILKKVGLIWGGLTGMVLAYLWLSHSVWAPFDFQILDLVYQQAVAHGHAPPAHPRITYLLITDETYRYFGTNVLDRAALARVNQALAELQVAAVAYDLIFTRPADPLGDSLFAQSLTELNRVYLPFGVGLSRTRSAFHWQSGAAFDRLREESRLPSAVIGTGRPPFARQAAVQLDTFARLAAGIGHISALSDEDGVYRHVTHLVRVDSAYFPSLSLKMFLDDAGVPLDSLSVHWGRSIMIPATAGSFLEKAIEIPIDRQGRTFIPYADLWGRDFKQMTVHTFLQRMQDPRLRGNMLEFFENSFVFIGEASIGIADLGATPLEKDVPLVAIHASLFNAFLQNCFYSIWSDKAVMLCIAGISLVFLLTASLRHNSILYIAGLVVFGAVALLTYIEMEHFRLFPVGTAGRATAVLFFGLVIGLQVVIARDQAFIRQAFSRYVAADVVNELLANPEQLQLGGEERELTVLFSDLVGFTPIAEKLPPRTLVQLLNDYFTEMTQIIQEEGGIIDKYLGDAIMAEFGAPLPLLDHPVRAVRAALLMQRRLMKLKTTHPSFARLRCRIGINTGPMVVGNIGSHQSFNYTVIGDAVNLAARLESANRYYGTSILISESTFAQLPPGIFHTRLVDLVRVKGKSQAIEVYEVFAFSHELLNGSLRRYYRLYEEGIGAYLERNFARAEQAFHNALAHRPGDVACSEMLRRLKRFASLPDSEGWDVVFQLNEK